MPRRAQLPPQFAWLADKVDYVQQHTPTEYSSTCPQCGGSAHPDGEWPDRLRIFVDDSPLAWCRRCSYMRFADEGGDPIDPDELERWRKKQKAREEARRRSAERALKNLRKQEIHLHYHQALIESGCDYWQRVRHLDEFWVRWWQLGVDPEHRIYADGQPHYVPTATIPLLEPETEKLANVKHRMIHKEDERWGKYRYQIHGQPSPPFICNPDEPLDGHVIAVEGEIKAMVTFATLDDANLHMIGLPGATPGQHIVEQLSDAERITLVMDPGARKQAWKLAKALGTERVWVLIPPCKVDDGIIASGMDKKDVQGLLRQAKPATG